MLHRTVRRMQHVYGEAHWKFILHKDPRCIRAIHYYHYYCCSTEELYKSYPLLSLLSLLHRPVWRMQHVHGEAHWKKFLQKDPRCIRAIHYYQYCRCSTDLCEYHYYHYYCCSTDLCEECDTSTGSGYSYHPRYCHLFVHCTLGGEGQLSGQVKECTRDLLWSQKVKQCVWPNESDCPNSECMVITLSLIHIWRCRRWP